MYDWTILEDGEEGFRSNFFWQGLTLQRTCSFPQFWHFRLGVPGSFFQNISKSLCSIAFSLLQDASVVKIVD